MSFDNPTVQNFKDRFVRDFPYGTDVNNNITDTDIQNGMSAASAKINQAFYGDQIQYTEGFLQLSAHCMVLQVRGSGQGLNGQFNFMQGSKGAGGVSESFSIPSRISDNPMFNWYTKTNYGAQYLMDVYPYLIGAATTVHGETHP